MRQRVARVHSGLYLFREIVRHDALFLKFPPELTRCHPEQDTCLHASSNSMVSGGSGWLIWTSPSRAISNNCTESMVLPYGANNNDLLVSPALPSSSWRVDGPLDQPQSELRLLTQRDGEAALVMQSSASSASLILCVVVQLPQALLLRQNNCSRRQLTGPSSERRQG